MSEKREHYYIPKLKEQLVEGKLDRREFLRYATLLGLSAPAAYAFAGKVTGEDFVPVARAQGLPQGGNLKIAQRVVEVVDPHSFSWVYDSNVVRQVAEYLTKTGHDNITRPYLVESWEASDDLKTWTLNMRKGVKWHNGRDLVADDAIANLMHMLNPESGSSVIGLMKGYMMNDEGTEIWDANAIEKIDDHTFQMNLRVAQVAIPEHLFHYPAAILDPEEGFKFGIGSNGTGAFDLVEHEVGVKSILKARDDYWGDGPHLDVLSFIDLGDDPSAEVGAIASKQVHGNYDGDVGQVDIYNAIPHVTLYQANTAQTAVARLQIDRPEFADPRVRKAFRLAIDSARVLEIAHRNLGAKGEHHHVSPVHPDYYSLPDMARDVAGARQLLADAGYADGFETEIACKKDPAWELNAVQAMVEQWKEAGINVNINLMPSAQFWDNWDKVPFGFTSWTHRPLGFMVLALAYRTGVPWNESHYANAKFDELLTTAEGTLDIDQRKEIMKDLETIMQEEGPIVQPVWRAVFSVMDKSVQGYQKHPTNYIFGEELAIES